jgi:hypothetical protein
VNTTEVGGLLKKGGLSGYEFQEIALTYFERRLMAD